MKAQKQRDYLAEFNKRLLPKLKSYFNEVNRQVKDLGGGFSVDTSGGLDKILDCIEGLQSNERDYGIVGLWNSNAANGRYTFCREVVLYFMATGKVPDFNINQIVNAAETQAIGHIAESFRQHAAKLRSLRNYPTENNLSS